MSSLSCFSISELEADSILALTSVPYPPLSARASGATLTSYENQQRIGRSSHAASHVTFRAKIKSSGYGSAAAVRPSWSVSKAKVAVDGRGKKSDAASIADSAPPLTSHPSPTPELVREDRQVFGKAPASALAAASSAALSTGPVACLGFSPIGDHFFVGAHAGDLFTGPLDVVDGNLRAGLITRRTGLPGRALNAAFSAGTFARASVGLVSVDRDEVMRPVTAPPASADFATAAGRVRRVAEQRPGVRAAPPARLMLGVGEDSAAYIWAVGAGASASPILALRSPAGGDASTHGGGGAPFPDHVKAAQFAYVDRLVLLSSGSRIYALRYTLGDDGEHADDNPRGAADEDASAARRRAAGRRYTVVASWASKDSGAVVALAAPNAWRSPLVFAAFADKSVRAFDLSLAGDNQSPPEVLRITNAHSRGLHSLALPLASSLCDVSEASLDCVLSAAADGMVKLWDVRSAACAQSLSGSHTNRAARVGIALSPCATYVAAGSECGRTAVYDLRNGEACGILTGSRDCISAAAWHPALPRLAVASLDGGVRFYAPP
jgi:hypothetical protein